MLNDYSIYEELGLLVGPISWAHSQIVGKFDLRIPRSWADLCLKLIKLAVFYFKYIFSYMTAEVNLLKWSGEPAVAQIGCLYV